MNDAKLHECSNIFRSQVFGVKQARSGTELRRLEIEDIGTLQATEVERGIMGTD